MKNSIKSILLVNWMYFQKTLLSLDGNLALVGQNGTGKSTIIDALQMVLLGQKASKFNSGANAEKRTLESYVRGHVNLSNKEFLRPNDVVTYVVIEVSINKKTYILGVNVEYKALQSRLTDPRYFLIEESSLIEELFIKENKPKTFDEFSKDIKKNFKCEFFNTLTQYQNKIRDLFGLKDSKGYFKVLSRAIGLKNITECNRFMNDFVLDENNIDVSAIKKNILDMKRINETIKLEEEKLNALTDIVNIGSELKDINNNLIDNNIKVLVGNNICLEKDKNIKLKENETYNRELENSRFNSTDLNTRCEELKKRKIELELALNNISPDLGNKQSDLDRLNKYLDEEINNKDKLKKRLDKVKESLKLIKKYHNEYSIFNNYLNNEKYSSIELKANICDFRELIDNNITIYSNEVYELSKNINSLNKNKNELFKEIEELRNNKAPIDNKYKEFKEYLISNLKEKYRRDIDIKFLCECLEIEDEEYRNAIEGYLGNQRFYIVIPNEYYDDAKRLYEASDKYHSIRIINGKRVPITDAIPNTLGSIVRGDNLVAINFARYILNRVHIAENINDLENYDIAITKGCLCYQGYTLFKINPALYKYHFIGTNGLKNQLITKENEFELLSNKIKDETNKCDIKKVLLDKHNDMTKLLRLILEKNELINSIDHYKQLIVDISDLENYIKILKENPQYIEIQMSIDNINEDILYTNNELRSVNENITNLCTKISINNNIITDIENNINNNNFLLCNEDYYKVEEIRNALAFTNVDKDLVLSLRKEIESLKSKFNKINIDLVHKMKITRDKFNINVDCDFDHIDSFLDEKNKIQTEVFNFKEKLVTFQEQQHQLFFNEFLNKLYKSIEDAKKIIKGLNDSLKEFKFGNDTYSISYGITDNKDLKEIYEFAKEYNQENYNRTLYNNDEFDIRKQKITSLIDTYMLDSDVSSQNILVDYRNYMSFDVIVHTPEGNKSLNKVIRSQSGGEVQVPFYILSGVAFKQTLDYKRNKNCLGIVLYDEAFDKMDSQRIKSMIDFYKDVLELQIILAAPGKLEALGNSIENIFVVIKDADKAIVKGFKHE